MSVLPADVATALDPELDPVALARLTAVEAAFSRDVRTVIVRTLQRISAQLAEPEIRVVFAGRFSSGKSTLVNALLGFELLPTGDYPETGVPCRLRGGSPERAALRLRDGRVRPVPVTPAAISDVVTLTGPDGAPRAEVLAGAELVVTTPTTALLPSCAWVDTPGVDDENDADRQEAWVAAMAGADLLVWVTRSDIAMGLHEMALLDAHIGEYGPDGALLVINMITDLRTEAEFEELISGRFGVGLRRRAAEAAERRGIDIEPPILLAARSMARYGAGFGGHPLWSVLTDPGELTRRAGTTRRYWAAGVLRGLLRQVDELIEQERADLHRSESEYQQRQVADEHFAELLSDALDAAVRRCADRLRALAETVAAAGSGAAQAGAALHQGFAAELATLRIEVRQAVAELCQQHLRTVPDAAGAIAALDLDDPTPELVAAAAPAPDGAPMEAIGALGGALLGLFLGPIGAAAGGALGGAAGRALKERSGAPPPPTPVPTLVRRAGGTAAGALGAQLPALVAALAPGCRPVAVGRRWSDTARLDALLGLRDDVLAPALRQLGAEPFDEDG